MRTINVKRYSKGYYRGYPDPWWPDFYLLIVKVPTGRAICKEPTTFTRARREVLHVAEDYKTAKAWIATQPWGGHIKKVADYYKTFKLIRGGKAT